MQICADGVFINYRLLNSKLQVDRISTEELNI